MENLLINYLLTNCAALTKEFFSQDKASTGEDGGAIDFLSLLNSKMGSDTTTAIDGAAEMGVMAAIAGTQESGVMVVKDSIDETAPKNQKGEAPQENEKKEEDNLSLPTQNIFALLQTYLHMKGTQETNLQDDIEKFLNDIFAFLQEGESVEFVKEKGSVDLFAFTKSNEEEGEIAGNVSDGSQKKPENMPLIGYLAAMLHQMGNIEKTDGKNTDPEGEDNSENRVNNTVNKAVNNTNNNTDKVEIGNTANNLAGNAGVLHAEKNVDKNADNNKANNGDTHKVVIGKEAFQAISKPEIIPGLVTEGKQNDDVAKSFQKIEVKKIDSRENVFQIITREPDATEDDDLSNKISMLTIKADKIAHSSDEDVVKVVYKISDKEIDVDVGKDERQLLSQNDYTKMSVHTDKETAKVIDKTAFASMMADRIEKIAEQYGNKTFSMDMVIRLKIDDKETILVGLKDQGQRISVEVKTTNEGMGNFLQSQKEEIARQLEGKFVYANIYVDVQHEGSQKKEQKEQQKKQSQEENKKDFGVFLEALA